MRVFRNVSLGAVLAATTLAAAACGGGGSTPSGSSSGGASGGGSGNVPQLTAASFTNDFSAMTKLKPLVAQGKGKIAVILPDTVSSARYTEFDAPYLKESFL